MKSVQFTHADKLTLQDLMFHHIHEILLVASPYDSFVLEEDGRLTEQILHEYMGMNFSMRHELASFYAEEHLQAIPPRL